MNPDQRPTAAEQGAPPATGAPKLAPAATGKSDKPSQPAAAKRLTWADIDKEIADITFLWDKALPNGQITMLGGPPGSGKSVLAMWLVNVVTTGCNWPDGSTGPEPGTVVWCESEGSLGMNLGRAKQFGVPLESMTMPLPVGQHMDDFRIDIENHLASLRETVMEVRPKLVVVDSLTGSHGAKENEATMQRVLKGLRDIAIEFQVAALVVHHTRKPPKEGGSKPSLHDLRGSSAIGAVPRSVLLIDQPDTHSDAKRLTQVKNNITEFIDPLGFRWAGGGTRLEFMDPPTSPRSASNKQDIARGFLLKTLADGPLPIEELRIRAEAVGLNWETVRKAKADLPITVDQSGGPNRWSLEVPAVA